MTQGALYLNKGAVDMTSEPLDEASRAVDKASEPLDEASRAIDKASEPLDEASGAVEIIMRYLYLLTRILNINILKYKKIYIGISPCYSIADLLVKDKELIIECVTFNQYKLFFNDSFKN